MELLKQLQDATLAARKATGNNRIGTCVSNGLFQIVEWDGGDNLTAVSRFMRAADCIALLNEYSVKRKELMG